MANDQNGMIYLLERASEAIVNLEVDIEEAERNTNTNHQTNLPNVGLPTHLIQWLAFWLSTIVPADQRHLNECVSRDVLIFQMVYGRSPSGARGEESEAKNIIQRVYFKTCSIQLFVSNSHPEKKVELAALNQLKDLSPARTAENKRPCSKTEFLKQFHNKLFSWKKCFI
uniref:Uncharacterized protein n=1 Tax=Syphacia muris TaxID=451379 RepID=A0A0N5AGX3_9BILA